MVMSAAFFLSECFPNGTMTALAVKLESVPSLNPSQLVLRDPTCGSSYSDDRYAYFVFTGNSCGTTRRVTRRIFSVMQMVRFDLWIILPFLPSFWPI